MVQAVGTDAWAAVRERLAQLVSRGDGTRQAAALTRLDQTGRELASGQAQHELIRWESSWQTRIEVFLDSLPEVEQAGAAAELRLLVDAVSRTRAVHCGVRAGSGGLAVGGDVSIDAASGAVAGGVVRVEGGVHLADPFSAGREQA
ncbi:hypothetical protein QF035_011207 [Streptomyces umbrinus]|uniref:Uncharacterized protein n=1 Tax=Streptomyces umbrinus TaxID=67370 RepID=A0ABU0TCI2_9ACTN|nr:hypothetical protein [Streptomyces umbrinus]MDQ1033538.1 hypothetical protein [Streptomyces umbrinus]